MFGHSKYCKFKKINFSVICQVFEEMADMLIFVAADAKLMNPQGPKWKVAIVWFQKFRNILIIQSS